MCSTLTIDFTTAEGDCAIDAMCVLAGLERLFESRQISRQKLHTCLICNAAHVGSQKFVDLIQEFQDNNTSPSARVSFADVALPAMVVAGPRLETAGDASKKVDRLTGAFVSFCHWSWKRLNGHVVFPT